MVTESIGLLTNEASLCIFSNHISVKQIYQLNFSRLMRVSGWIRSQKSLFLNIHDYLTSVPQCTALILEVMLQYQSELTQKGTGSLKAKFCVPNSIRSLNLKHIIHVFIQSIKYKYTESQKITSCDYIPLPSLLFCISKLIFIKSCLGNNHFPM